MNIVSNNCIGGRLYEVRNEQFANQFIWARILHSDFIYLINNFDNIDFSNVSFNLEYYKSKDYQNVICKLDNKISMHFTHYVYNENYETPYKKDLDVLYKNILEYSKDKYFNRLKRMSGKPIFVYSFNGVNSKSEEYIKRIHDVLKIKDKKIYIIAYKSVEINSEIPENIKIIYLDDDILNSTTANIAKNIKDFIKDE